MGKSKNNRVKKKNKDDFAVSPASKTYSLKKKNIIGDKFDARSALESYEDYDDAVIDYQHIDSQTEYTEAYILQTENNDDSYKRKEDDGQTDITSLADNIAYINSKIKEKAVFDKRSRNPVSADTKKIAKLKTALETMVKKTALESNSIKIPREKNVTISTKIKNIKQSTIRNSIKNKNNNKQITNFRKVEDMDYSTTGEQLYGVDKSWHDIVTDYKNTGFNWLLQWITSDDVTKVETLVMEKDSIINDDKYSDIQLKCLLDVINYIISELLQEDECDVLAIANANDICVCKTKFSDNSFIYKTMISSGSGHRNIRETCSFLVDVAIRLNYLILSKRYVSDIDTIKHSLYKLQQDNTVLRTERERYLIDKNGILNDYCIALRNLPEEFYNQYNKNKEYYQLNQTNFSTLVFKLNKNILSALEYLSKTLMNQDYNEILTKSYFDGELDIIYNYLFKEIVKNSELCELKFTKKLKRDLNAKSDMDISVLPQSDRDKIVYVKSLSDFILRS